MIDTDVNSLPREVREGLTAARARDRRRTGGKLRVQVGGDWYPILSADPDGFEVAEDVAPRLRGLVEIHDGPTCLRTALIVAGDPGKGTVRYEFKRSTAVRDTAPLDYERAGEAPAGYIADR